MRYYLLFILVGLALPGRGQGGFGGLLNKAKQATERLQQQVPNDRSSNPGPPPPPSVGKMLFSNVPFTESVKGVKSMTSFSATDHIYCRLQLDQTVQEAFSLGRNELGSWFDINLDFEYKEKDYKEAESHRVGFNYLLTPAQLTQKYVNFDLYPTEVGGKSQIYPTTFDMTDPWPLAGYFCKERVGGGTVTFEIHVRGGDITETTFKLGAPAAGTTSVACQVAAQVNQKKFKSLTLPPEYGKPSAAFQDPELSLAALRKRLSSPGAEITRLVVEPGSDYQVMKDDYGRILFKMSKVVYCTYKDVKTGNCYFSGHTFRRQYEGGGTYGQLSSGSVRNGAKQIECAQLKASK